MQEKSQHNLKSLARRVHSIFKRRIDPTYKGRVSRIINNPPDIREDLIVFTSSGDYTGNPKALFLYMIEHGYNERYKIVWLFERAENFFEFNIPNVSSAIIWNDKGIRTPAAQRAAMSAKYIFYSHNVHWVRKFREGQYFINLWHGCGYKADMKSDDRKIYYDYLMVTGRKYIDIFKAVLRNPDGNILDLGYPRNEMLFSSRSKAEEFLEEMKTKVGADKVIIWMPTYRKSVFERLTSDTLGGSTGLPVLYEFTDLTEIDEWCRIRGVLLLVKQHFLQSCYDITGSGLSNVIFLNDDVLRARDADTYELMGNTDALITDYSSAAIDYMLLDKPLGYTLDDFDNYENARGWSFDNVKESMPGHHIYTIGDMKEFIKDITDGEDRYAEWRGKVAKEVHTYREGFSRRILEYFGI